MTNKMTYVAALTYAIENLSDAPADVIEKLSALKAQTEKRNASESKAVEKRKTADISLQDLVASVLRNSDKPMTITEIMNADATLGELSNQKVAALVRGMGDKVIKTIDKRKAYFSLA